MQVVFHSLRIWVRSRKKCLFAVLTLVQQKTTASQWCVYVCFSVCVTYHPLSLTAAAISWPCTTATLTLINNS